MAHAVECKECKVRKQWNEELINENRYLKSLLLESRVEHSDNSAEQRDYTPIGGIKTWRSLRSRLERESVARKQSNENPEPESQEV